MEIGQKRWYQSATPRIPNATSERAFHQKLQQRRTLVTPLPPSPRHNDCLDKKYVPCRENILHHARKLEIFDVLAGYFLLVKSTQFMLPQLPPQVWEIRSDVFIDREEFNNMETQITFCN